jgi:hypothetical protein
MADQEINYETYNDGSTGVTKPNEQITQTAKLYKLTTSFSHLLGNITSVMEQYIEDMMPKDYFKQKRITTEAAFKDIKDWKKNLIDAEKPYLIIDPKIVMDQESDSLPWTHWDKFIPHDHNATPMIYMMNHEFFYQDRDHNFALGYTIARYKFQFNITIILDTQMQRLELENYLKSNFRFKAFFPIERYTETMISKPYIDYIADKYQLDITSEDFLTELNKRCPFTILRLHRPATGLTEFFILQMSTIQIKIPDYPQGQRNMKNRIEMSSSVSFPIEIETNLMNNFLLLSNDEVNTTELMSNYMTRINITSKAPTIENFLGNMSLYSKIAVQFDSTQETIDLSQFLSHDTLPLVRYVNYNNLIDDYVQIRVYKWTELLDHTDINIMSFDKKTFKLTLNGMDPEVVYNIAIYFDMNFLAKIKKFVNPVNTTGKDYNK